MHSQLTKREQGDLLLKFEDTGDIVRLDQGTILGRAGDLGGRGALVVVRRAVGGGAELGEQLEVVEGALINVCNPTSAIILAFHCELVRVALMGQ